LKARLTFLILLCAAFVAGFATPAAALTVNEVRFGQHPGKTRMVLELSGRTAFRAFVMGGPDRLVIDMPAYDWNAGDVSLRGISAVSSIRQGPLQSGTNRIVVDLARPSAISSAFIIPANQGLPDRLVIDFAPGATPPGKVFGDLQIRDGGTPVATLTPPAAAPLASASGTLGTLPARKPVPPSYQPSYDSAAIAPPPRKPENIDSAAYTAPPAAPAPQRGGAKPVVVIDAGHGGVDPGAIGTNGVFEKHVTLAMAKELKAQLESTGNYIVHLTRDSDKFLRLYQRVEIARSKKADLFISLHADTIGKGTVRGASIYTLSEKASDAETAELADRENKVDLIAGADLTHADKDVASILVDLSMRDTMNQSKFLANTIVERMRGDGLRVLERPHRSAGFAVLKAPDVPSVLMEIGFMSNNEEARLLNDPGHRQRLGAALRKGVDAYFEKVRHNNRT
jgi:N-acetylmuramoyl-L-alanine amidase